MKFTVRRSAAVPALLLALAPLAGCSSQPSDGNSLDQPVPTQMLVHPEVQAASNLFTAQKTFDPWIIGTTDPNRPIDPYLPSHGVGTVYGADGRPKATFDAGQYRNGVIVEHDAPDQNGVGAAIPAAGYSQTLDLFTGELTTRSASGTPGAAPATRTAVASIDGITWPQFWKQYDIAVSGDPEAQQAIHANMFYLAGSSAGKHSIPPMGLSSVQYLGHIFWDAETWMFPALVVQHPALARGIIDYRFARLRAAEALAKAHGYRGAEFPWESAANGKEEAPGDFGKERHITADIAFAAWQYYLWTGDLQFLRTEGWPLLKDNADYWVSRAVRGADGKYHIKQVIGPDENSDVVDDDAWTNAVVASTLRDAGRAAAMLSMPASAKWTQVAQGLVLPKDASGEFYIEYPGAGSTLDAKQADTQLLIYPLDWPMSAQCAGKTLDNAMAHTEKYGPAMTDSINAIIAARLGRAQQSLDLFNASYRPFMRGPWDAFSEKRNSNGVYFCTGMGGCLQTVLYGFGGLNVVPGGKVGLGKRIAGAAGASLYAQPHLPPGWRELKIDGIAFQGHSYNLDIKAGNQIDVRRLG